MVKACLKPDILNRHLNSVNKSTVPRRKHTGRIRNWVVHLRIGKGYPGGAAHSGTCIHNYGGRISMLYIS